MATETAVGASYARGSRALTRREWDFALGRRLLRDENLRKAVEVIYDNSGIPGVVEVAEKVYAGEM
jgi:hypothetical protein